MWWGGALRTITADPGLDGEKGFSKVDLLAVRSGRKGFGGQGGSGLLPGCDIGFLSLLSSPQGEAGASS